MNGSAARRYAASPQLKDLLVGDGEALALTTAQLVRLSAVGALLVQACQSESKSAAELTRLSVAEFGEPPGGASSMMDDALAALVGNEVLCEVAP